MMHSNNSISGRARGATLAGIFGLAMGSALLFCGAGSVPVENFSPQGPMQSDLNAGGHAITNAASVAATNLAVSGTAGLPAGTTVGGTALGNGAFAETGRVYNGPTPDGKCVYDAVFTSGSPTLTSATASFTAGDAGKTIVLDVGAASARQILTIASVTNATTITLSASASASSTAGLPCLYGTDMTVAVQAAITACTNGGGGTVFLPAGIYLCAQAPGGAAHAVLTVAAASGGAGPGYGPSVVLEGDAPAAQLDSLSTTFIPTTGTVLYFPANATAGAGGNWPAAIASSAYNAGTMNNVHLRVQNLTMLLAANPTLSGIQGAWLGRLEVDHACVSVDVPYSLIPQPTNASVGVYLPGGGNYVGSGLWGTFIHGMNIGLSAGEHAVVSGTYISKCENGVTFSQGYHAVKLPYLAIETCPYYIDGTDPLEPGNFIVEGFFDIEDYTSTGLWSSSLYDLNDAGNHFGGILRFHSNTNMLTKNGGASVTIIDAVNGPFKYHNGTVDTYTGAGSYSPFIINSTGGSPYAAIPFQENGGYTFDLHSAGDKFQLWDAVHSQDVLTVTPATGAGSNLAFTGTLSAGTGNANYVSLAGSSSTVNVSAAGTGSNIDLSLMPKGDGQVLTGAGGWAYTTAASGAGSIFMSNGTTDAPNLTFAYGNNVNFSVDCYVDPGANPILGLSGQVYRFIHNANEAGGAVIAAMDVNGNFNALGDVGDGAGNYLAKAPQIVVAPASASSAGTPGQIAYDASYFYVCTATNTWKRTALSSW